MTDDEYHGVGGSYVADPKTGKRVPAPPPSEEPVAAPASAPKPARPKAGLSTSKDEGAE